jgi:hypothetical protein
MKGSKVKNERIRKSENEGGKESVKTRKQSNEEDIKIK